MKFAIVIVAPPGYAHFHAYDEIAETLHYGLIRAGHESRVEMNRCPGGYQPIVLGASVLQPGQSVPPGSIIFNFEQIVTGGMFFTPWYIDLLRANKVWDYSPINASTLRSLGVKDVTVVPIGYVPELTRIKQVPKDIDVLFYGSGNRRRERILQELHFRGAVVKSVFGVYGSARDELIARSRIVINIHFYEARILEIVRIAYLLANEVFVVTEQSADGAAEKELEGGIAVAPYERLVDTCLDYLRDEPARISVARCGFDTLRRRDQSAALASAIASLRQTP